MRRIARLIVMAALAAVAFFASEGEAGAQFNDPINTAVNATHAATATADALDQFVTMLQQLDLGEEQLGNMKEWKEKIEKWNSNIQEAVQFIDQMEDYIFMWQRIESYIDMLNMYANAIKSSASAKFNPYYLSTLLSYGTQVGYAIDGLMDAIDAIKREDGLTKAERQQLIDQRNEEIIRKLSVSKAKINDEISYMIIMEEFAGFINFALERKPEEGLSGIGAQKSFVYDESYSDSSGGSSPGTQNTDQVISGGLNGGPGVILFRIIQILIGLSCLGSLIFAFARFAMGKYESESMFVRIFVVSLVVGVIMAIIGRSIFV